MKAAFYTLGCKVNQYESEVLARRFADAGYEIVSPEEQSDVYVINSCTVTSVGDQKTRQIVRRMRRKNPEAVIVLSGCFPQAFPKEAAALLEADIVTGARHRESLPEEVRQFLTDRTRIVHVDGYDRHEPFEPMAVEKFEGHTRVFVKIEDGCDRYCSYCIIPKARGPVRSKSIPDLKSELAELVKNGYREAVLVGINLSSYGKESGKLRLAEAVEAACSVAGIERVRLGSLEPDLLTDEDLSRMAAQKKFCPQFHLSLQSGCDATLKRMNRHYTAAEYADLVRRIRAAFDNAAITTDIMTGFPGETEEEFAASLRFAEEIGFAKVHVFAYSVREGTRAAAMPQIPQPEKDRRSREMIAKMDVVRQHFLHTQLDKTEEVLFETPLAGGGYIGYTKNYTPVAVCSAQDVGGLILPVTITGVCGDHCVGELACGKPTH